ncbi:MAG: hypothetical protein ACMUEL_03125 [Flavobacteriales bacterium Tduv]
MIVDVSIRVSLFSPRGTSPPTYVGEGWKEKAQNQINQRKVRKKTESIGCTHSSRMVQDIRETLLRRQEEHSGV